MFLIIVLFVLVLGVLIFVHELGHFLLAKLVKAKVDEFAIGFPPRIFKFKKGETLYSIGAIPLGGFVKILGEDGQEGISPEDSEKSLNNKPNWAQALVLVAGVVFNLIFAWLLIFSLFIFGAPVAKNSDLGSGVEVFDEKHVVLNVEKGKPADLAGLVVGDQIISVSLENSDEKIEKPSPEELIDFISKSENKKLIFLIIRQNQEKEIKVQPFFDEEINRYRTGILTDSVATARAGFFGSVRLATEWVVENVKNTFIGLGHLVQMIFNGTAKWSYVSGPVGIASMTKNVFDIGLNFLLTFVAFLSVNLAVLNILPLPALDGGRLLVLGVESVIRRRLPSKIIGWVHAIGLILLLLLSLIIAINDIANVL